MVDIFLIFACHLSCEMEPHSLFFIQWETLHGKPHFIFIGVLKGWPFQKDLAGTWSLLCYRKRWYFFPENIILYPRRKMKDDLSQKKYTEIWYFLQTFWKDGVFKIDHAGTWSFLYCLERWYFFPENIFFPWAESERWPS